MAKGNTTEEKEQFVQLVTEIGFAPAMKALGYPKSTRTAWKWLQQYGVDWDIDQLKRRAALMRNFYSQREKLALGNELVRVIAWKLQLNDDGTFISAHNLTPQELNQLTAAYERAVKTIELLEGRVTERTEHVTVTATDLELRQLIDEVTANNEAQLEQLRAQP